MTDPLSLALGGDRWLTDSRVYSLIWMGRWLERAEGVARAVDAAALAAVNDSDPDAFPKSLRAIAAAWGITAEPGRELVALLYEDTSSSVSHSLTKARTNAHQVGPLELINALNAVILQVEERRDRVSTPEQAHQLTTDVLAGLNAVYKIIEANWFRRQALSEEEVYKLFIQQQQ